jgi:R3H domain
VLARLTASLDSQLPKKSGKKSRKATIRAAKLDPTIEIPNQIVDMVSLEQQIRKFLSNKKRSTMALPAVDKETRKNIHILAGTFNLKSKSKDGASGRYPILIKTKHSGFGVDEKKIARLMKSFKSQGTFDNPGKAGQSSLNTREGDVVGHVRTVVLPLFNVSLMFFYSGRSQDRRV